MTSGVNAVSTRLCGEQEKRTMRESEVLIGNSGLSHYGHETTAVWPQQTLR